MFKQNQKSLFVISAVILLMAVNVGGMPNKSALAGHVKIMSYNVQSPGWTQERRKKVAQVINNEDPEVLGLHEVTPRNGRDLQEDLAGKYYVFSGDTFSPILIRKDAPLKQLDYGKKSIMKDNMPRQVNWIKLQDEDSGKVFIYYNTHLIVTIINTLKGEYTNEQVNQIQGGEIVDLMVSHTNENVVQILSGDMNVGASSNTIKFLLEQQPLPINGKKNPLSLNDCWKMAGNTGEKPSSAIGRRSKASPGSSPGGGIPQGGPGGAGSQDQGAGMSGERPPMGQGSAGGQGGMRGGPRPQGDMDEYGRPPMGTISQELRSMMGGRRPSGGGQGGRRPPSGQGSGGPRGPMTIDWIIATSSAKVIKADIIRNELTRKTSDHCPVFTTFEFSR